MCIYISKKEDYDIVVDLDDKVHKFENMKQYIVFIAEHICELDNTAQKYIYNRHPEETEFEDILAIVYMDEPYVMLEYWGETVNTQYLVKFIYEDDKFKLKSFGMIDDIPDDWDK